MRSFALRTASLLFALPIFAPGSLLAQNCANTSAGFVPLMDLGLGTYQGHPGGLWGSGSNVPPASHAAVGTLRMNNVVPRDPAGVPDSGPGGRIVVLSIGMSNTSQEFSAWQQVAAADPNRNAAVTVVNGAQGGQDAVTIANPAANFWNVIDQRLAASSVTKEQVQVLWIKQAIAGVTGGFPVASEQLRDLLVQIVGIAQARYPNVQLCFCSSRTYAGYATTMLNPEPYAYESGFSVQWLLERQVNGDPGLNADPSAGPITAPWLGFGPYLWADGTTPRSDGFTWTCADVQPDGTHPSPAGQAKIAGLLQQFFTTNVHTAPWYVGGGNNTPAAVVLYGSGCAGTFGVPEFVTNTLPTIGNPNFAVGVRNAAANALAGLWFSTATAQLPISGGCQLLVDPSSGLPLLVGVTNALGRRIEHLVIPTDPSLVGAQLFAQWLLNDATGVPLPGFSGIATSRGGEITIGY